MTSCISLVVFLKLTDQTDANKQHLYSFYAAELCVTVYNTDRCILDSYNLKG